MHREGTFPSASGGETFWQAWVPENPKALVLLAHGVAEHSGRYAAVAERLNSAGYAVYAVDHHGHGKSSGTPGNLGRMSWLAEDFDTLRFQAANEHTSLPIFLLGHSLGGLLVLDYLIGKGEEGLVGIALSGPAVDVAVGSRIELALAPLISRIAPNLPVTDLGIDNISRDPGVVTRYREDPLVYTGRIRARTGAEVLAAVQRVQDGLGRLTLPVLVQHGGDDRLATPTGGQLVHDRVSSADKTLKLYTGLFHEIFNEPERAVVLDDLVGWLDAHV